MYVAQRDRLRRSDSTICTSADSPLDLARHCCVDIGSRYASRSVFHAHRSGVRLDFILRWRRIGIVIAHHRACTTAHRVCNKHGLARAYPRRSLLCRCRSVLRRSEHRNGYLGVSKNQQGTRSHFVVLLRWLHCRVFARRVGYGPRRGVGDAPCETIIASTQHTQRRITKRSTRVADRGGIGMVDHMAATA